MLVGIATGKVSRSQNACRSGSMHEVYSAKRVSQWRGLLSAS